MARAATKTQPDTKPVALPAAGAPGSNYPVISDKKIVALVAEYAKNEARNREIRPIVEAALNGAPIACAGAHVVKLTPVAPTLATPNTVISAAMVGQVIPGKKARGGYNKFEVR